MDRFRKAMLLGLAVGGVLGGSQEAFAAAGTYSDASSSTAGAPTTTDNVTTQTTSNSTSGVDTNITAGTTGVQLDTAGGTWTGNIVSTNSIILVPTTNSSGTFVLTGANTTTGTTRVGAGTTVQVGSGASQSSTVAIVTDGGASVVNDGTLSAPTFTISSGSTLSGSGTIAGTGGSATLTVAGTFSPGNSPGTTTLTNLTTTLSGTTNLDIDGTRPASSGIGAGAFDQIIVNGGSLTPGGTLVPITRGISGSANNNFTPAVGNGFAVVTTVNGGAVSSSGSFSVTQPGSGLLSGTQFDVVYSTSAVTLYVTPTSFSNLSSSGVTLTQSETAAADALQSARPSAGSRDSTDKTTVYSALYAQSASNLKVAYDQVSGSSIASVGSTSVHTANLITDALTSRANHTRVLGQTGLSAGSSTLVGINGGDTSSGKGWAAWVQPLGQVASADRDSNAGGFDRASYGALGGLEMQLDRGVIGASFGYVRDDIDSSDYSNTAKVNNYAFSVYGGTTVGKMFFDASVGYILKNVDTKRNITFGGLNRTADGSSDGGTISFAADAGYTLSLQDGIVVEPSIGLRFNNYHMDAFSETGANSLNLTVDEQDYNSLTSVLGARIAKNIKLDSGTVLVPEARIGWEHQLLDSYSTATARLALGGSKFTVNGVGSGDDAALIGIGLKAQMPGHLDAYFDYSGRVGANETDHGFTAGLRYKF
ncbi:MAG: autotransporter domain-containing protein [Azospirillum sp.]|nr:autotransporter domain-containing protein [Azospirillum sp.]